jgi:hypothetical protein
MNAQNYSTVAKHIKNHENSRANIVRALEEFVEETKTFKNMPVKYD